MPLLRKGQVSIWSCRQYVPLRWTGGFSGVGYPIAAPPSGLGVCSLRRCQGIFPSQHLMGKVAGKEFRDT